MQPLLTYVSDCRSAMHFQHLVDAALKYVKHTPVKMLSYVHYPPIGIADFTANIQVLMHGYPDTLAAMYRERRYFESDPLSRKAAMSAFPFFWREVFDLPNLTHQEKEFLAEAEKADLGTGIAVPVFGPLGRNGYCALGFGSSGYRPDPDMIALLQMACQTGHIAYCDLLMRTLPADPTLSKREKEILRLVAHGQTNGQIAKSLNISANTVHTYVRRCFEKLDVTDRVTAALRGMALGLLD